MGKYRSRAEEILTADPDWVTARHTAVEVRRNLARELRGAELRAARRQLERDRHGRGRAHARDLRGGGRDRGALGWVVLGS